MARDVLGDQTKRVDEHPFGPHDVAMEAGAWSGPAIAEALQMFTFTARAERGCLGCSFVTEPGDDIVVLRYREDWATEADLQRQIKTARFAKLAELLELGGAHAHVEFEGIGTLRGIEYAKGLRCGE